MSDVNHLVQAFSPYLGVGASTVSISAGNGSSASVTLPAYIETVQGTATKSAVHFLVYNSGTVPVAIAFGGGTVVAVAPSGATPGGLVIPPGIAAVLTVPGNPTNAAALGIGAAATVYVTPGIGR